MRKGPLFLVASVIALTVVEAGRKNSALFIALLKALREDCPQARRIHVALDNYRIHRSQLSRPALAGHKGRIVLHCLPPCCPSENRVEQLWEDLYAEVTRNHGRGDGRTDRGRLGLHPETVGPAQRNVPPGGRVKARPMATAQARSFGLSVSGPPFVPHGMATHRKEL